MPDNLPNDAAMQITNHLLAGKKIEAIKLYREHTGAGLAEAKDFIERMEAELHGTPPPPTVSHATPPVSDDAIAAQIFSGRKIEAIKLYREQKNVGLKEAKDAVDVMEAELRRTSPDKFGAVKAGGCLGVMVLLLGIAAYIPLLFFAL